MLDYKLIIKLVIIYLIMITTSCRVYSQSEDVYKELYEKFNPTIMDYNPYFEYTLDKENKKMIWIDDDYNLVDEFGNEFNSRYLIDLATYKKGYVIMVLSLKFTNKKAAKLYHSTLTKNDQEAFEIRLRDDGLQILIINITNL